MDTSLGACPGPRRARRAHVSITRGALMWIDVCFVRLAPLPRLATGLVPSVVSRVLPELTAAAVTCPATRGACRVLLGTSQMQGRSRTVAQHAVRHPRYSIVVRPDPACVGHRKSPTMTTTASDLEWHLLDAEQQRVAPALLGSTPLGPTSTSVLPVQRANSLLPLPPTILQIANHVRPVHTH